MTICGEINQNIAFDCNNPLQAGAEDELILINRADWLAATVDVNVTNPQIIEDIVLGVGKNAYRYEGKNNSVIPKYELIKQAFAEVYNHEVNFKVFKVDAEAKAELEKLAKGTVIAIVQNKFKGVGGNSSYEVYGADAGLILSQNLREVTSADTQGAFDCILKSDENGLEPHMPKTLFITDYATTKGIVDGLIL